MSVEIIIIIIIIIMRQTPVVQQVTLAAVTISLLFSK
jgi:hypothetical protein